MATNSHSGFQHFRSELLRLSHLRTSDPLLPRLPSESAHYITKQRLKELWTPAKIRQVLRNHPRSDAVSVESVRAGYLRVFSLLVWCGAAHEIREFTDYEIDDNKFPLRQLPHSFVNRPHLEQLFHKIRQEQWTFFPLSIRPGQLRSTIEEAGRILPIQREESIKRVHDVAVHKTWLDPDCCEQDAIPEVKGKVIIVRKVYIGIKHKSMYDREELAYQRLQRRQCEHIVHYYGSFTLEQAGEQHSLHNLLLEYVDGVNLEEFFSRRKPPKTLEELLNFWRGFVGPLQALHHMGNLQQDLIEVVHQDLNPSNVMVCRSLDLKDRLHLKVTDFGHSSTANRNESGSKLLDMMGGKVFGAPETCRSGPSNEYLDSGPNLITSAADVWSAGAMMSDAAAWVHGGTPARQDYNKRRAMEVKHRRADFEEVACFHNGVSRLRAVEAFHSKIKENLPSYDREITGPILTLVENSMLLPEASKRQTPERIIAHLNDILVAAESGSDNNNWDDEASEPIPERPKPRFQMSRNAAVKYYNDKKRGLTPDPEVQKTVNTLRANLSDRDFLFLVDTSASMKQYEGLMRLTLLIYTYIAKNIDQDGHLEVYFNPQTKLKRYRSSSTVTNDLAKQGWNSYGFERIFGDFIDNVLSRLRNPPSWPPTPQSIFVFTDGRWPGLKNVKDHIRRVTKAIADQHLGRTQVSIQFVSFGTDEADIGRLQELDIFGRREVPGMDIVDAKPYDSDVCAVLYGALVEDLDKLDEPESSGEE